MTEMMIKSSLLLLNLTILINHTEQQPPPPLPSSYSSPSMDVSTDENGNPILNYNPNLGPSLTTASMSTGRNEPSLTQPPLGQYSGSISDQINQQSTRTPTSLRPKYKRYPLKADEFDTENGPPESFDTTRRPLVIRGAVSTGHQSSLAASLGHAANSVHGSVASTASASKQKKDLMSNDPKTSESYHHKHHGHHYGHHGHHHHDHYGHHDHYPHIDHLHHHPNVHLHHKSHHHHHHHPEVHKIIDEHVHHHHVEPVVVVEKVHHDHYDYHPPAYHYGHKY